MFWNCSVRAFDAYSSENFKIALDVYAMAIKLVQENSLPVSKEDQSRLYYNRARASTHLNCRVKAMKDLESALDLAPNYTNARALLSQCQFDLYQYDRCVQGLKLVLDKDPNNNKWNKLIVEARRLRDANHYEVLGIERNADEKEIKKAYRNASKKWHPDKHQKNEDNKARANTMFKRVNEANQVLGDSYKKLLRIGNAISILGGFSSLTYCLPIRFPRFWNMFSKSMFLFIFSKPDDIVISILKHVRWIQMIS